MSKVNLNNFNQQLIIAGMVGLIDDGLTFHEMMGVVEEIQAPDVSCNDGNKLGSCSMNKSISIPSKFDSVAAMFAKCTGHIPVKNEATTAPQSLVSVRRTERVDVRIGQIL